MASQRLAGYLLEEQIGLGGMAVVYRATDERLGRRVALKLLAPALAQDTGFRQRFIRESRAAAAVDHPNIIPIYEAGETDGALFIAMRYVQGGDVRSLLERESPLSPDRVWSIVSQVASALDAAHEHDLVHRDVKPGNMLLDASGGRGWTPAGQFEHVYLSDFGISKQQLASAALTQTGQFVGTLDYIAPEQIESQRIDGRADQYSLACAAFELLAGTRPFRKDTQLGLITAHLTDPPPAGDLAAAGAAARGGPGAQRGHGQGPGAAVRHVHRVRRGPGPRPGPAASRGRACRAGSRHPDRPPGHQPSWPSRPRRCLRPPGQAGRSSPGHRRQPARPGRQLATAPADVDGPAPGPLGCCRHRSRRGGSPWGRRRCGGRADPPPAACSSILAGREPLLAISVGHC